jgi:hypothetical protein
MLRVGRLLIVAAAFRALYIAALVALDLALPDYDTSARLLSADCDAAWPARAAAAGAAARAPRGSLVVWDAVFFHRVAACGYEYEQFYAFFPGFPGAQWGGGGDGCGGARACGRTQERPKCAHRGCVLNSRPKGSA